MFQLLDTDWFVPDPVWNHIEYTWKNINQMAHEDTALKNYMELDLYSETARVAMARLGLIPSDLEPIDQFAVEVPNRFQDLREEFVQGKLEFAEAQRQKRVKMFLKEMKSIKSPHPNCRSSKFKSNNRSVEVSNSSRVNPKTSLVHVRESENHNQITETAIRLRLKKTSLLTKNPSRQASCNSKDLYVNNLPLRNRQLLYQQALKQNLSVFEENTHGVKRNYKEQNKLLRPKTHKAKVFSQKQNIKTYLASSRRLKDHRVRNWMEIQFMEGEIETLRRLGDLQQRRREQCAEKKRVKEDRHKQFKLKNLERTLISSSTTDFFRQYQCFKMEHADKVKSECIKDRIKGRMQSYYKADQVNKNKEIEERRRVKKVPFQPPRLQVKRSNSNSLFTRTNPRTQQVCYRLGANNRISQQHLRGQVSRDQHTVKGLTHDLQDGDSDFVINNPNRVFQFVTKLKACLGNATWDDADVHDLGKLEDYCRLVNWEMESTSKHKLL